MRRAGNCAAGAIAAWILLQGVAMAVRNSLTAIVLLAIAACTTQADDQLPWASDFAAACQQANAQGKLVLVHFYSDDCPPCVRVERNVFSQAAVAEAVGKTCVPVKVHARKSAELAAKYGVQQWPTDVFVLPNGQEVSRSISPQSPDQYIQMANSMAAASGVPAGRQNNGTVAGAPPQASAIAPWAAAVPQNAIAQVNAQADAVAPWMAQGAADARQQVQQTAQQVQQGAQQLQQGTQQQAQQAWQYAQGQTQQAMNATTQATQQFGQQATQAVAAGTQAAQQTAQSAQQSTQAAADAAKEIINRYATPLGTTPPAVTPPGTAAPAAGNAPWQQPASVAANSAPPLGATAPAQTLAPTNNVAASPQDTNPALAPSAPAAAANNYSIAMGGYCPVTLATEKKWKKGQPQFGVMHRRRTFLFASEVEQKKFLLDPDKYSPVMTGYDPVKFMQTGELVDGSAAYSLTYRKQIYLFTSDASLKSFWQNPVQFTEGLRQAMNQQERGTSLR
jgi:thioredoxin-related protein/YHS domain-containing protein